MPTYEYRCQSCGEEMEAFQRIVEPPLTECPACHKPALERLISATSFQLKGSGWYKDGYGAKKNASGKERTENDRGDRLEKAIKDDKAKTEAATETKTEAASTSASESGSKDGGGGSSPPSGGKSEAA